ncbi:hypothetical protein FRB95_003228, partial [Tulasnella sp. JGI-2019a]
SCIPCHELRRKCDRLRPCTRCSEHGTAGQCVYQLEDPAKRDPNADELTRLRERIKELEHTVRVLTQRGSPEGGLDQSIMEAITGRRSESEESTRKKGRRDAPSAAETHNQSSSSNYLGGPGTAGNPSHFSTAPAMRIPGAESSTQASYTFTSPRGSPGSAVPMTTGSTVSTSRPVRGMSPGLSGYSASQSGPATRQPVHCGCAISPSGRAVLGQLQANLDGSIQRMKGLPEHRIHGVTCPLYQQMTSFGELLRSATQNTSPSSSQQQLSSNTPPPQPSYSYLQGQGPAGSSSSSSGSPPQEVHHNMASMGQQRSTFDLASPLQPTHPYPFTTSHSSTLSHSLSQPHASTSSQQQSSYSHMPMPSISPSQQPYQNYQISGQSTNQTPQQQHQQHQSSAMGGHQAQASPAVPYSGYSSHSTSLSTWNSMSAGAQPPTSSGNRVSSRHTSSRTSGTSPSHGTK